MTDGTRGKTDIDVLVIRGITKTYPGVRALQDVSLSIRTGTVHALVGENGAGKSTLVKVITGAVVPDAGEIEIGGERLPGLTPGGSQVRGISVIHQERQIAFDLSITENVLLGRLPVVRPGVIDWRRARREAEARLGQVGLEVDVRRPVRELGVGQLQALEISRALSADARVIVMDEPTSALSGPDVNRLFETIRRLREHGVAVLYISHHLEEVFEIADDVTVLRDGRRVVTRPVAGLAADELVTLMLGRAPEELPAPVGQSAGEGDRETVIEAHDLHLGRALQGVSVAARRGEIICVTGAIGSGRRELARCLAGVERPDRGSVLVGGRTPRGPRDAIRRGVVFLPEDRKREGLFLDLNVTDNICLGRMVQARTPFVSPRKQRREAATLVERLRVRTRSLSTPARLLSGGNQQKVMLSRWLEVGAGAFVFDEPTAGVDVGTKMEIYGFLRELAGRGAAVVLFSSDFEEIKLMADRVIVLRRGRIAGEVSGVEVTEDRLLALEQAAA
jgi:monosaccharide-transporting ATPase